MDAEFLEIFYLLFSVTLSTVVSGASYLVGIKQPDSEKVYVYECGFDPLGSSRTPFSHKKISRHFVSGFWFRGILPLPLMCNL